MHGATLKTTLNNLSLYNTQWLNYLFKYLSYIHYKTVIAPIWTYGLELWGCASKSNIAIIQRFQSKLLRATVNAPWYITNAMIHSDLGILTVQDVIHDRSNKHRAKLQSRPNPLLQSLSRDNIPRRLKRRWPIDL